MVPWRRARIVALSGLMGLLPALPCVRPATACTTAVIDGRSTVDGRPLLWKNRDTSTRDNEVSLVGGGKYRVLAVTNAGQLSAIWMGVNEAGLCIENSLSKDLAAEGATGPGNGGFMRTALQSCATIAEFEELLRQTDATGRSTTANIGVIDATGATALYEVGPTSHRKFTPAERRDGAGGYVVRSNFSMTATGLSEQSALTANDGLYSGERYRRGCRLIEAGLTAGLDARYLLRQCSRDLADEAGSPHPGTVNGDAADPPSVIDTRSTISRRTTVSAAVFHGVKPGEPPALTTMWVFLGDPTFSVAVPCWVTGHGVAPELDGAKVSELCEKAKALRDAAYAEDGNGMKTDRLRAIYGATWAVEDSIYEQTQAQLDAWRITPPTEDEVFAFHRRMCRQALEALTGLTAPEAVATPAAPAGKPGPKRAFQSLDQVATPPAALAP